MWKVLLYTLDDSITAWALRTFESLEGPNRKRRLSLGAVAGVLMTVAMWWVHLANPSIIFGHSGFLSKFECVLLLAPPFLASVSFGFLLFPEVEESISTSSGPMSGYLQRVKADTRWRIIVTSGALSAANLLCMMFTSRQV